ncbi:MAG TPA: DNA-processing protein DprA [Thermoanaerobaculia bacterium]
MTDSSARDLLIALSLLPFLTPNRTRLLIETFDPLQTACNASSTLLEQLLHITPEQAAHIRNSPGTAKTNMVLALRDSTVTLLDDSYPSLLREIPDPPLVLHFRGNASLLETAAIAVVGSRRASPYAVNVTERLTRELAASGLTIVSGLARGVDATAHQSALRESSPTIAVLGTGIDVVYPRSNAELFRRMVVQGLIISEFPPDTPPRPENFPVRNRIISGLAFGTVVIEATGRSGSLITARMAAEQGREVFAVPGSIFSSGSEGTHRLIQYGAKLVHDVSDVLEELPGHLRATAALPQPEPPSPLREVLAVLNREEGRHIDFLSDQLRRTPSEIAESLLQLELGGWIRALPGARYVRTS